jgi:hypothetical protein
MFYQDIPEQGSPQDTEEIETYTDSDRDSGENYYSDLGDKSNYSFSSPPSKKSNPERELLRYFLARGMRPQQAMLSTRAVLSGEPIKKTAAAKPEVTLGDRAIGGTIGSLLGVASQGVTKPISPRRMLAGAILGGAAGAITPDNASLGLGLGGAALAGLRSTNVGHLMRNIDKLKLERAAKNLKSSFKETGEYSQKAINQLDDVVPETVQEQLAIVNKAIQRRESGFRSADILEEAGNPQVGFLSRFMPSFMGGIRNVDLNPSTSKGIFSSADDIKGINLSGVDDLNELKTLRNNLEQHLKNEGTLLTTPTGTTVTHNGVAQYQPLKLRAQSGKVTMPQEPRAPHPVSFRDAEDAYLRAAQDAHLLSGSKGIAREVSNYHDGFRAAAADDLANYNRNLRVGQLKGEEAYQHKANFMRNQIAQAKQDIQNTRSRLQDVQNRAHQDALKTYQANLQAAQDQVQAMNSQNRMLESVKGLMEYDDVLAKELHAGSIKADRAAAHIGAPLMVGLGGGLLGETAIGNAMSPGRSYGTASATTDYIANPLTGTVAERMLVDSGLYGAGQHIKDNYGKYLTGAALLAPAAYYLYNTPTMEDLRTRGRI